MQSNVVFLFGGNQCDVCGTIPFEKLVLVKVGWMQNDAAVGALNWSWIHEFTLGSKLFDKV